ncbi:hypothetical protein FS749_006522 [Ceratobasidium sp. UAMH 11750]|nr:hypothetical protein FS749_006522 [Ceratobasidium sp. UAMH 11750]
MPLLHCAVAPLGQSRSWILQIFKHYYGFLCVRYLVHIACLSVLREANLLDRTLRSLPRNLNWVQMSQAIAFAALNKAGNATVDPASLQEFYQIFEAFYATEGKNDISFLVSSLWKDRDSFLEICLSSLLPGCPLLLLAALKLLPINVSRIGCRKSHKYLQELAFRLYLVGSHRDRQVLEPVCLFAIEKEIDWPDEFEGYANPEDSRTVAEAYSGLLVIWQQNGFDTRALPINLVGELANFVHQTTMHDPLVRLHELIDMVFTSLRLLWLIFDDRRQIPTTEHVMVREYAIYIFEFLEFIQLKHVSDHADQHLFAILLADVELFGLAGRVLLLVLAEGNEFQATDMLDLMLDRLKKLGNTIERSVIAAPDIFHESKIEWIKVVDRMTLSERDVIGPIDVPGNAESECLWSMFEAWAEWSAILKIERRTPRDCAYPRCFESVHKLPEMAVPRYTCGRCRTVAYCNSICQRA